MIGNSVKEDVVQARDYLKGSVEERTGRLVATSIAMIIRVAVTESLARALRSAIHNNLR